MAAGPDPRNLFITNLAESVTESDVEHAFEKYGKLKSCRIITDHVTRASKVR